MFVALNFSCFASCWYFRLRDFYLDGYFALLQYDVKIRSCLDGAYDVREI